ncbi:MAG TPA: tyrosine protein kinase, partial [Sporichthyaceae bacterium]|nr:tyrosine protein kinase [Sporichthyaceae bacterium]
MSLGTHPASSDLVLPLPGPDETWDPHTVHTHYFGFSIPEAQIGAFIYIRYQPAFPLCQGGVAIFRGTENYTPTDIDHLNYEITMPWPTVEGNRITTANGLSIEFIEPGRTARLTYSDGDTSFDIVQAAVTPLLARGHIMPGEEDHHDDPGRSPGGTEQFMHAVGTLTLNGEQFDVDCYAPRDRSWRQVRKETRGGVPVPPVGWSPMYFGEDLIFNQISFESPDTDPAWTGLYELPAGRPTHHFAWVIADGESLEIVRVRRNVLEYHPVTHVAVRQEIEAEDERGRVYHFKGEAIASATLPAWPNV